MDEDDIPAVEQLTDVKDLRSNKKKENMEKQKKQKANDVSSFLLKNLLNNNQFSFTDCNC